MVSLFLPKVKVLQIATIVVIFIAFLVTAVSAFTPNWAQFPLKTRGYPVTFGFFQACLAGTCRRSKILTKDGPTRAAAACMITSAFLSLIGWIVTNVGLVKGSQRGLRTGGIITIKAGIFAIIGGAVFASCTAQKSPVLGYSFVLAWVAAVLALAGGILALILAK